MNQQSDLQKLLDKGLKMPYDRVLVLPDETLKQTKGGIFIPDTGQEKPRKGVVVALGPDCEGTNEPDKRPGAPKIGIGSRIVFGKYAGAELKIDGIEVIIIREHDYFFAYDTDLDIELL